MVDPSSEAEVFAFRIGSHDVKWVIHSGKFVVNAIDILADDAAEGSATDPSPPPPAEDE